MQILQASTFSYIYLYLPVDRYSKKKENNKNEHKEVYFVKLTPYVLVVILLLLQRCKTEQQTWIKRHNPCENNPNPRDYFQSLSNVDLSLGLDSASFLSYFQWLRFLLEKTDFIGKHAWFIFLYRGSVIRWSLTSTIEIRYNFGLKQRKKPPKLLGIWHWPNFLWKIPKLSPLKRKGKKKWNASVFISTGIENTVVLSETFALMQTRWLVR